MAEGPGEVPRRRWWPGCLALVVLLGGGLIAWVLAGSRDLPPPADADLRLVLEPLDPEANALTWFARAAAASVPERDPTGAPDGSAITTRVAAIDARLADTASAWDAAAVEAELAAAAPVFAALERGLGCGRAQPDRVDSFDAPVFSFLQARVLAAQLRLRAEARLRAGDGAGALADAERHVRLGQLFADGPGPLIQLMVGVAIRQEGLAVLRRVAGRAACPPDALLAVVARLPASAACRAALARSFRAEYTAVAGTIASIGSGAPVAINEWGTYRPGYAFHQNRTLGMLAADYRIMVGNAEGPVGAARPVQPPALHQGGWRRWLAMLAPNSAGKTIHAIVIPGVAHLIITRAESEANLDATRVVLATLAYRRMHGRLPERLDALVPGFLAAVPPDPWDGRPLRYDAATGRIWFVGRDGADDGGAALPVPDGSPFKLADPTFAIPSEPAAPVPSAPAGG